MAGGVLLLSLWMTGCEPTVMDSSTAQQTTGPREHVNLAYWQPTPKSVRVYPSTRFVKEAGNAVLEARFELNDEMGDPIKAAGTFRVELYSVDESAGHTPVQILYEWEATVLTLEEQRLHYDPITRGYLFRLRVENLKAARQPTLLRVTFIPASGGRLESEALIRPEW
ncbi:MAG: hypothetical protein Kow00105_19870 [Phycisphaeraceae bacterium]